MTTNSSQPHKSKLASRSNTILPSPKKLFTSLSALAASIVLIHSVIDQLLPHDLQHYIFSHINAMQSRLSSQLTVVIQEIEGFTRNQIYSAANTYLADKIPPSTKRLSIIKKHYEEKSFTVAIKQGEAIMDEYQGIQFKWQLKCQQIPVMGPSHHQHGPPEIRSFELIFHQKHRDFALNSYLPYILQRAKAITNEERTLKLYSNYQDNWMPANLRHPATFDTLAMDSKLKHEVMEDLARFVKRKDYYKKIGKAWKRGYLMYGPPGTGKSSLIAAMANYLKFDIYDLELTEVQWNSSLRRLLAGTTNRSILVIEDIDCSIDIQNRNANGGSQGTQDDKVTLSGLLNFIDGLWSSCGEERIIVFTTNYKERLDPALLRPGRMDMHIHMGYCTCEGFRVLASNYHGVDNHPLFNEIEELIQEVEVTPAQVAEELLKSNDAEVSFVELIKLLQTKRDNVSETQERGTSCLSIEGDSMNSTVHSEGRLSSNLRQSSPYKFRGRGGRRLLPVRFESMTPINMARSFPQQYRGRGGRRGRVGILWN